MEHRIGRYLIESTETGPGAWTATCTLADDKTHAIAESGDSEDAASYAALRAYRNAELVRLGHT